MKHPSPIDEKSRFSGPLRHYHRSGPGTQRSWDEWVDGKPGESKSAVKWLKIAGIVLAFLALGGIIVGLVIELW
jgi:hypothetical protein